MSCEEATHTNIDGSMIKSSQKETLLGINFGSVMKFEDHVNFMCKKSTLIKITPKTLCACSNCTIHGFKRNEKNYETVY